jgi:hypothetical protein
VYGIVVAHKKINPKIWDFQVSGMRDSRELLACAYGICQMLKDVRAYQIVEFLVGERVREFVQIHVAENHASLRFPQCQATSLSIVFRGVVNRKIGELAWEMATSNVNDLSGIGR